MGLAGSNPALSVARGPSRRIIARGQSRSGHRLGSDPFFGAGEAQPEPARKKGSDPLARRTPSISKPAPPFPGRLIS